MEYTQTNASLIPIQCIILRSCLKLRTYSHSISAVPFRFAFVPSLLQATKTKLRAELWKRQSIEDGGLFIKYFAVLEKGRLDFYVKEKVWQLLVA